MLASFGYSFQSEWIKKRRSLASWIVLVGGFFTSIIIIVARLIQPKGLETLYLSEQFWQTHWKSSWESMAIFLLPLGVILATSLITQLEFKNNTWKQLHTLPLNFTTIFFSKLAVIVVMLLQFFLLFNIGIFLSAIVPCLLIPKIPFPQAPIPYLEFLRENALYLICCLPILAIQYLISLRFKNFLVPVGTGFIFWVGALSALSWKFGYLIPYTYTMYHYLKEGTKVANPAANIYYIATLYFVIITAVNYVLFITKKEKG